MSVQTNETIEFGPILENIRLQHSNVNEAFAKLQSRKSSVCITDVMELQMKMQNLTSFSEIGSAVTSAAHGAISSITRNIK